VQGVKNVKKKSIVDHTIVETSCEINAHLGKYGIPRPVLWYVVGLNQTEANGKISL
jgi:hypothetical protein